MHGKPTKQGRYEGTKFAGWNAIKLDAERVNRLKKKKTGKVEARVNDYRSKRRKISAG